MNLNTESSKTLSVKNAIILMVFLTISALFTHLYMGKISELEESNKLTASANKEIVFYKDKYGRQVALSEQLKTENVNTFLDLKTKDSTIISLQKLVTDNKDRISNNGSATVIKTEGNVVKTTPTKVIPRTDVTEGNDYPTYESSYKDKWATYSIVANADSTSLKFKYLDEYSIVLGKEKDKNLSWGKRLISKKVDYAWVTTASPYSEIKSTRTYNVSTPPTPRLSLSLQAGYGVGVKDLTVSPYIGVGLSYRIMSLGF